VDPPRRHVVRPHRASRRHALVARNAPYTRRRKKKGTANPVAPYLTGTSFSNEQTVRQIPREITSSERGRGHRVTTRSLACTSCQTRHSDAASYAARFRFRSGLVYT